MPNTKIVLNSQSDLILTGAQLLEPSGLVQGDIEGLVAQLAAIDKAAMNEASLRTAADSSLEAKIAADVSTEKAAGDAADQSLEAKIDADVSTEKAAREAADISLEADYSGKIKLLGEESANNDSSLETKIDADISTLKTASDAADASLEAKIDADISTEKAERESADSSLDTRVNEAVFNSTPGVDSMDEIITGFNNAMVANVYVFMPTRESVEAVNYDSGKGLVTMNNSYQEQSFMFFINGLMVEPTEDYTINLNGDKTFDSITLLGDAKTLADNGAKMVEYGVSLIEGNVSQVTSAIVDPNGEGEGEGEGTLSKG